jgi:hypothetical protein
MRIFARQELQQKLVQVEAADERRATDSRKTAAPLGVEQRFQLRLPRPRQDERLKRLQQSAQLRAWAPRAARHHRDATVFGGDRLDDHARLAIRIRVQDEPGLVVAAQRLGSGHGERYVWDRTASGSLVPEAPELGVVVRPALRDPDPDFEKDLAAEETLHVDTRRRRDFLHPLSAFTQENRPLACPESTWNRRVNPAQLTLLLEAVDRHRCGVRDLLAQQPEDLLADELRPPGTARRDR